LPFPVSLYGNKKKGGHHVAHATLEYTDGRSDNG